MCFKSLALDIILSQCNAPYSESVPKLQSSFGFLHLAVYLVFQLFQHPPELKCILNIEAILSSNTAQQTQHTTLYLNPKYDPTIAVKTLKYNI
jgi:hypothetical protein